MEQETPGAAAPEKPTVSIQEKIAGQEALVARLVEDYNKKPSPELEFALKRKTDTLLYLKNLAKDDPRQRAENAAAAARASVLGKAIVEQEG